MTNYNGGLGWDDRDENPDELEDDDPIPRPSRSKDRIDNDLEEEYEREVQAEADAQKEDDDDPVCVCGVSRSEHQLCGCPEGFQTQEEWNRERRFIQEMDDEQYEDWYMSNYRTGW